MKNSFIRSACALAAIAAFSTAGAAGTQPATHHAEFGSANVGFVASEAALLQLAVTFDRAADLAEAAPALLADKPSIVEHMQRCRFTSSKNALRPRKNECRLV